MAYLEPSAPQGPGPFRAPSDSRSAWLALAEEIEPQVAHYFLVSARCGCFMQAARSLSIKATLLRKRLAPPLFLVSLLAIVVQMVGIFVATPAWQAYGPAGLAMPVMLVVIAAYLCWYAQQAAAKGWLG